MWVFVGGLAFVAAGGLGMYQSWRLNRTGKRVPGIVVDLHWRSAGKDGGQVCYPVVEFRTVDGPVIRAETRVGGSPAIASPAADGRYLANIIAFARRAG